MLVPRRVDPSRPTLYSSGFSIAIFLWDLQFDSFPQFKTNTLPWSQPHLRVFGELRMQIITAVPESGLGGIRFGIAFLESANDEEICPVETMSPKSPLCFKDMSLFPPKNLMACNDINLI